MGLLITFLIPPILILCLAVNNTMSKSNHFPKHAPPPPLSASFPRRPPAPASPKPRFVRCRSPFFRFCKNMLLRCPPTCPSSCLADCATCKPVCSCNFPGAVCQDPRFVGGDGVTFYFHGHKDRDYCLVSDSDLHINGHFIGKTDPNPNSHRDFTWVQSIGITFNNDHHHHHNLLVAAKPTSKWNQNVDRLTVNLNGNQIYIPTIDGAKWEDDQIPITITRTTKTNGISIHVTDKFMLTAAVVPITEEDNRIHKYGIDTETDCFAHLEIGFNFFNLTESVDGVLGQTYRRNYMSRAKVVTEAMPMMRGEEKYLTSGGIFASDCAVSRFRVEFGKNMINLVNHCKIGIGGKGLICK